jgi:beta-lactam-binding protein with PASTA domain
LGISPDESESAVDMVTIRDYIGADAKETKEIIEGLGLKCEIKGSGKTVVGQMPKGEVSIAVGGKVILYTEDTDTEDTVTVPDVTDKTPEAALKALLNKGLNVQIKGVFDGDTANCYVISQSIPSGAQVAPGTIVVVQCRYEGSSD